MWQNTVYSSFVELEALIMFLDLYPKRSFCLLLRTRLFQALPAVTRADTDAPSAWWNAWPFMSSEMTMAADSVDIVVPSDSAGICCLWLSILSESVLHSSWSCRVTEFIILGLHWPQQSWTSWCQKADHGAAPHPLSFSLHTKPSNFFQVLCWLSSSKSEHIFLSLMK